MSISQGAPQASRDELLAMISGHVPAFLIRTALRLGVFERVGDETAATADLARDLPAHEPTLRRMLRALAALELLTEREPDVFALTPRGALLRPGTPGSLHGVATVCLDETWWSPWPAAEHTVRTGEPAFTEVYGTDYFSHPVWAPDSPLRAMVDDGMAADTDGVAAAFLAAFDLARFSSLVDVGGGSGTFAARVLAAHPHLRGVVLDQADGLARTGRVLAEAGVADRCAIEDGDFFASVPSGDLLLCKSVVFNWDDDRVAALLAHCRRALPDDGRLFLFEDVLPAVVDGSVPAALYLGDMDSAVVLGGGRLRTEPEHRALLAEADFTMSVHSWPGAASGLRVIEAAPA